MHADWPAHHACNVLHFVLTSCLVPALWCPVLVLTPCIVRAFTALVSCTCADIMLFAALTAVVSCSLC
jgi:hypothetical protein